MTQHVEQTASGMISVPLLRDMQSLSVMKNVGYVFCYFLFFFDLVFCYLFSYTFDVLLYLDRMFSLHHLINCLSCMVLGLRTENFIYGCRFWYVKRLCICWTNGSFLCLSMWSCISCRMLGCPCHTVY